MRVESPFPASILVTWTILMSKCWVGRWRGVCPGRQDWGLFWPREFCVPRIQVGPISQRASGAQAPHHYPQTLSPGLGWTMPKEGASLCVCVCESCLYGLSSSLPMSYFASCLWPAVCQSLTGRGPQGAAEGLLSLAQRAGPPPTYTPTLSSFLFAPAALGARGRGSNYTLGS